jgi:hypothetical protein
MPLKTFKTMRAGLEATRGTGVAMARGIEFTTGQHDQVIDTIYPEELRNSYEAHYTATAGAETNTFDIEAPVDFDIMPWWGNLHMKAIASGTGAGADKTWTFLPTLTSDDQKSATVQFGYTDTISATQPAVSLAYVIGDALTLSWEKAPGSAGVMLKSHLVSPKAATQLSAFSGTGTYTTSELAKAQATVVTIDPTTIGTTADNDVISAEWTYTSGYQYLYTLNNTTAAQDVFRPNPLDWTLKLVRYYRNDNEWDRYVDKVKRKIRIKTTGSVIPTTAVPYSVQLDCYGVLSERTTSESDGLGFEELTYKPLYDTTLVGSTQLVVVCASATIT